MALMNGKNFELRKNDRDYHVGEVLILEEWNPRSETYTGNVAFREITYVMKGSECVRFGLTGGYCILGLEKIDRVLKMRLMKTRKHTGE